MSLEITQVLIAIASTVGEFSMHASFIKITDYCHFVSGSAMYHSNIRVLDLSHNNISKIYGAYFK